MWFFLLSGLIACAGNPVSSSCPLKIDPPAVVMKYGDPLLVNCTSLANQSEGIGWESSYGGTGLKKVSFLTLDVKSVETWKIDPDPMCFMTDLNGYQCIVQLPVTIYKMPDSVSLSQINTMEEGKTYDIQCEIAAAAPLRNLSVYWHKGNEIIDTQTFDEPSLSPANKAAVLKLNPHRDDHGRDFWCETRFNFWQTVPHLPKTQSRPQKLTVLYPPFFSKPAEEIVTLQAGSKFILNCTATGNPAPVYSWNFPHKIQRANVKEDQPILTPSIQLPGIYNCTATNTQGTRTKHFTVIEPPRNRTTLAALIGGFGALGFLLLISGLFLVKPDGTFGLSKGSNLGQPTSSGVI